MLATNAAPRFDAAQWYTDNAQAFSDRWNGEPIPELDEFLTRIPAGAAVLDITCGSGRDVARMSAAGFRAFGLDIAPGAVATSSESTPGVIVRGSFYALPFADATVDAVWAMAALVHCTVEKTYAAFTETLRVTKPAGQAYFTVKHTDRVDDAGFDAGGRWFQLWDPDRFADVASAAGWTVDEARLVSSPSRPHVSFAALLAHRPS